MAGASYPPNGGISTRHVFQRPRSATRQPIPKRRTSLRATSTPHRWTVWKCLTLNGRLEKRTLHARSQAPRFRL